MTGISRLWAALAALAACAALTACNDYSTYFPLPEESRAGGATVTGREMLLGVVDIAAGPGDEVELEGVELGNVTPGTTVNAYVLPLAVTHGGVGARDDREMAFGSFDDFALPLRGYAFDDSSGRIQIVVGVSHESPARLVFDGVTLTFRVNGGGRQQERFPFGTITCVDDPRPPGCSPDWTLGP